MDTEYQGLVVVVTGASSGIGAALAEELSRRGARLALVSRRRELLERVAARCAEAEVIEADVTRREDVQRVLDSTLARYGRVDVWVNNVGRGLSRPFEDLTDDDVDTMMRDNVKSALYGMQTVLPIFKAQRRGVIVNVSSMLGRVPYATIRSAYSASKAALNSLTETLRLDVAADYPDIRVVLVIPGVVATEFGVRALGGGVDSRKIPGAQDTDEVARVMADGMLAGPVDLYTRPEGVGPVIAHLQALVATPPT